MASREAPLGPPASITRDVISTMWPLARVKTVGVPGTTTPVRPPIAAAGEAEAALTPATSATANAIRTRTDHPVRNVPRSLCFSVVRRLIAICVSFFPVPTVRHYLLLASSITRSNYCEHESRGNGVVECRQVLQGRRLT